MVALTPVTHLWVRDETKPMEHRSLSPCVCKKLLATGRFKITVESSTTRIFKDAEYADAGCTLAAGGSWRTAPKNATIFGLKELPENDTTALTHTHIMFAHCYKQQDGWRDVLSRFVEGNGLLYDLEFLQDDSGRRVAAFGFYAGFCGAAIAIDAWCHQQLGIRCRSKIRPYASEPALVSDLAAKLGKCPRTPRVLIVGAHGRCGRGAVDLARKAGVPEQNIEQWGRRETADAHNGFAHILTDYDVFVNCIYLTEEIVPFVTDETVRAAGAARALSVVADVSCDPNNPNNPIPIYAKCTTFDAPVVECAAASEGRPLLVSAIDHLPTMLPREASIRFSNDLLETLLGFPDRDVDPVWSRARSLFYEKTRAAGRECEHSGH